MARNVEKQFGRLNRLYLKKEKEDFERANPKRPRLDTLYTAEEVQNWLPSIKKDIDFYLKKSQVTCYSDLHVEECKKQVVKLEREFKAFVRKIKHLNPSPTDVIPWTNRPYKRKKPINCPEESSSKEFKRIATPILDNEIPDFKRIAPQFGDVDWSLMNQPLSFAAAPLQDIQMKEQREITSDSSVSSLSEGNLKDCDLTKHCLSGRRTIQIEKSDECKNSQSKKCHNIVNYDSSDSEDL